MIASLTRAAAAEIASRELPIPNDNVGTLHALCWRALGRPKLAETQAKAWNEAHPEYALSGEGRDVDDLGERPDRGTAGDALLEQANLLRQRCTPEELWPTNVRAFTSAWRAWMDEGGFVDFTGLLERALVETAWAPGCPEVLIGDETQDWSRLEYRLFAEHWGRHAETTILAADPDQAIYEWRGADARVFLDHPVPADQRRYLRQSYRVSRAVHALAQRIIREIGDRDDVEYLPRDEEGAVEKSLATWRSPERLLPLLEEAAAGGPSVMVLATCSYQLAPLLAVLRKHALPFANPYRRKRGDWNPLAHGAKKRRTAVDRLLAFLAPERGLREWTADDVRAWCEPLKSEGMLSRGAKKLLGGEGDFDVARCFEDLFLGGFGSDAAQAAMRGDLAWYLGALLPTKAKAFQFPAAIVEKRGADALEAPPQITVGTIHSVKGGEADVVVLFPDLSVEAARGSFGGAGRDAIRRVFYVGATRARSRIVVASPASPAHYRIPA